MTFLLGEEGVPRWQHTALRAETHRAKWVGRWVLVKVQVPRLGTTFTEFGVGCRDLHS